MFYTFSFGISDILGANLVLALGKVRIPVLQPRAESDAILGFIQFPSVFFDNSGARAHRQKSGSREATSKC